MKMNLIKISTIAFLFLSIALLSCASIAERMDAIAIPVVEVLETPIFDGDKPPLMLYKGEIYSRSKTAGKPPLTGNRFTPENSAYTDVVYIDVIYFDGKPVSYVVVADVDLIETDKCNMANYVLMDTDCDGFVDVKNSAVCSDLVIAECFTKGWRKITPRGHLQKLP